MKQLPKISIGLLLFAAAACSKSKDTPAAPKETVLYQTDFSSNDGRWAVGTINDGGATYYQNGNYFVVGGIGTYAFLKSNTEAAATFTYSYMSDVFNGSSGNIAAEASIKMSSGPAGAGMVWNFQSGGQNTSFYVFEINTSGQWGIYQYQLVDATAKPNKYSITTLTSGAANSAIQQNQFNKLQIAQNKGQLQFSVNGTQVYKMNATGNTLDQIGLFADVHSILEANAFEAVEWQ